MVIELKSRKQSGTLTKEAREKQEKLINLGLFDRSHALYLYIEQELQWLNDNDASAKMFDLFLSYCAKRHKCLPLKEDGILQKQISASQSSQTPKEFEALMQQRKQQSLLKSVRYSIEHTSSKAVKALEELMEYSPSIFDFYAFVFMEEYPIAYSRYPRTKSTYTFDVLTTISLSTILPHYSTEQRENIYEYLLQEHKNHDPAVNAIFEHSSDTESLNQMYRLFIDKTQKIDIEDVINNIDSPFYLNPRERETLMGMLKRERYRPLEYKFTERIMNYSPKVNITIDLNKPANYIDEMVSQLKPIQEEFNKNLGIEINTPKESIELARLRDDIITTNQHKTLAGKLTDILYVYDQKTFKFTNARIQKQLSNYWKSYHPKLQKKKVQTVSTSTIHTYFGYGKKMIDEQYYKKY